MVSLRKIIQYFKEDQVADISAFIEMSEEEFSSLSIGIKKGQQIVASGSTTLCYQLKKHNDRLTCVTNDFMKVLYLKHSLAPEFKFIKFIENKEGDIFLVYEIKKLKTLESNDLDKYIEMGQCSIPMDNYRGQYYVEDNIIEYIEKFDLYESIDFDLLDQLSDKYNINFFLDLHEDQFMYDCGYGEICIDPIISSNAWNCY